MYQVLRNVHAHGNLLSSRSKIPANRQQPDERSPHAPPEAGLQAPRVAGLLTERQTRGERQLGGGHHAGVRVLGERLAGHGRARQRRHIRPLFGHESIREENARTAFAGNLAAGYYFTPHDAAPLGDLVFHVGTTLTQLTDNRGPNTTTLVFTPGFRDYLGANFYLLAGIDLPVTHPEPFAYQPTVGIMKVF